MTCPDRLRLEILAERVVPSADLAEGNIPSWTAFASDGATTAIAADPARVADGAESLRFATGSGFDTGVRLASGPDPWDATRFRQLAFWALADNPHPAGFQGDQPVVVLATPTGSVTYTPAGQTLASGVWHRYHLPLDGGYGWQRAASGAPDLGRVTAVEFHFDTWDFGFTLNLDGVRFDDRAVDAAPPPGPLPPEGVTPGQVSPRVLLYAFDPVMENHGGRRLHEVYGWADPVSLTAAVLGDLAAASHGLYRPEVVETVVADEHPYFADGFQHTDAGFDAAWAGRDFHPAATFDYPRFVREHDLAARVDRGEVDEVWVYAPPIAGTYESVMAGAGAYWINGPTQPAGARAFPIMGLNYERGVGEAIHSFGHRAEGTLDHAYAGLAGDPENAWRRFTRLDKDAPGRGGAGTVHFPVNGLSDYDSANPRAVPSTADDWLNYPTAAGATRTVTAAEWSPAGADPQREYLDWWYAHLPHAPGRGPDGRLNDWWRYLGDLDAFTGGGDLTGADGSGRAWVTGVAAGEAVTGPRAVRGEALVDGVVGRMDLYVDGAYRGSDTVGPFTFTLDPAGLAPGPHTVEVRGYDVQAGTETRSPAVPFVVPGGAGTPPTVSPPGNRTVRAGQAAGPLAVTVADAETPAGRLVLTAASSNPLLVAAGGLRLGGDGGTRTLTVSPTAGQSGQAVITLTVIDADGRTAAAAFTLTVAPDVAPPVLVGGSGRAVVYTADGTLRPLPDPLPGFSGSVRTAVADLTGDGVPDDVVGTGPGGRTRVRVLDGADGHELFSVDPFEAAFTGGVFVAAGDLTGDGVADLVVCPDEGGGPRVRVFRGGDFVPVADFFGIDDPAFRGGARPAVGDLTGDGRGDLVVAAGLGGGPRVAVFDGTSLAAGAYTRKPFADFFAFEDSLRNGVYVAAGDLDGDGFAELVAGAGPGGGPRISAFAGQTLVLDHTPVRFTDFFADDPGGRDGVQVAAKDLDGDNRCDLVTGVTSGGGGRVRAYRGYDQTELLGADTLHGFSGGIFVG
ncbi:MAG: FG-GAP-like repeat-containing protein [Gemmataceae bacterium]